MGYGGTPQGHHLSSSSPSSTLSPLAPPFTVGRGGSWAAPQPYDSYPSSWSQGQASSAIPLDLPPHSQLSSADVSPYCGVSSGNLAKVEPYYPRYLSSSGSGIQSLDRDCREVSPIGQSVGLPNTPFDVGIEADVSSGSSLWGGAYGSNWQQVDYDLVSGEHHFNTGDLSGTKVEKSSGTSSFSRGISHLSPSTPVEEYNPYSSVQLSFGSKYISEVDTKKSDPLNFHKVAPYKENSVKHGDSFKNPNFQSGDEYSEIKKTEVMTAKSSSVKITAPPIIDSKIKISEDRVAGKSDIKTEYSENYENISSDIFDEHLVIDSPCWKGASSFRNHASSGGIFDYVLQASSDYSITDNEGLSQVSSFPREVGNNIFCGNFHGDCSKILEKQSDEEVIGTSTTELVTEMGNLISDPFCFPDLDNLMPSVLSKHDRCDEMVRPPLISDCSSILNPSLLIDAQLLVKTIHNLSSVLVTTCSFSENVLKEHDRELLQSTMNNLERSISRKIEDKTRPEPSSCSVCYSQEELITYPKDLPKENFPSLSSSSVHEHSRKGEIHTNLSNSEQTTEGIGDDLWGGVEDAVNQLKHKLDAVRSDLGTSKVLEPPKLLGQSRKEQIPPKKLKARESKVKPVEPLSLTRSTVDVDPVVMDRFRVLKDRMQRFDFFDEEQCVSSCGRVDSRVDFESGPSTHARAPGSSSARRFTDFRFGSSDWEHVLKEELT